MERLLVAKRTICISNVGLEGLIKVLTAFMDRALTLSGVAPVACRSLLVLSTAQRGEDRGDVIAVWRGRELDG